MVFGRVAFGTWWALCLSGLGLQIAGAYSDWRYSCWYDDPPMTGYVLVGVAAVIVLSLALVGFWQAIKANAKRLLVGTVAITLFSVVATATWRTFKPRSHWEEFRAPPR